MSDLRIGRQWCHLLRDSEDDPVLNVENGSGVQKVRGWRRRLRIGSFSVTVEAGRAGCTGQRVERGGSCAQKHGELLLLRGGRKKSWPAGPGVARGARCIALSPFKILSEIPKHLKDKLEPQVGS